MGVLIMGVMIVGILTVVFFVGFRAGSYFIKKENMVMKRQIALLESYSHTWATDAAGRYRLTQQVSQQHHDTMQTVIQLLTSFQQPGSKVTYDQKKIQQLIDQARAAGGLQ